MEAGNNPKQSLRVECRKELSRRPSKLGYRICKQLSTRAKAKEEYWCSLRGYIICLGIYTDSPRIARTNWSPLVLHSLPAKHPVFRSSRSSRAPVKSCPMGSTSGVQPHFTIIHLPKWSMYGIFTYIWVSYGVNVGKYSIHGASGLINHWDWGIAQTSGHNHWC